MIDSELIVLPIVLILFLGAMFRFSPEAEKIHKKIGKGLLLIAFSIIVWISSAYLMATNVVARELQVPVFKIANPDGSIVQVITYRNVEGKAVIENCNSIFNGVIPDNNKVLVQEFERRNKYGLLFTKPPTKYLIENN